jgi:hypothetical protein
MQQSYRKKFAIPFRMAHNPKAKHIHIYILTAQFYRSGRILELSAVEKDTGIFTVTLQRGKV